MRIVSIMFVVALAACTGATGDGTQSDLRGSQGPIGPAGPQGPKGDQGDSVQGPAGPKGATGLTGATGPVGATGATGAGVAGPQGPVGAQGIPGMQGQPGSAGAPGPQGVPGVKGAIGPAGAMGPHIVAYSSFGTRLGLYTGSLTIDPNPGSVPLPNGFITYGAVGVPDGYMLSMLSQPIYYNQRDCLGAAAVDVPTATRSIANQLFWSRGGVYIPDSTSSKDFIYQSKSFGLQPCVNTGFNADLTTGYLLTKTGLDYVLPWTLVIE